MYKSTKEILLMHIFMLGCFSFLYFLSMKDKKKERKMIYV